MHRAASAVMKVMGRGVKKLKNIVKSKSEGGAPRATPPGYVCFGDVFQGEEDSPYIEKMLMHNYNRTRRRHLSYEKKRSLGVQRAERELIWNDSTRPINDLYERNDQGHLAWSPKRCRLNFEGRPSHASRRPLHENERSRAFQPNN
jgi:hypothetical protein